MKAKGWVFLILTMLVIWAGIMLTGEDVLPAICWYVMLLVIAIGFYPLASLLFPRFADKGFAFGGVLGFICCSWLMWILSSLHILPFTTLWVVVTAVICMAAVWITAALDKRRSLKILVTELPMEEILCHIFVFTLAFFFFVYVKCVNPDAYGTERMMDYAFMQTMYRSPYMPAEDMWFAGESINYYYYGQYLCTYLTKLAFTDVSFGYNLSLCMCFALCVTLVFSLAGEAASFRKIPLSRPVTSVLSVIAVCFAASSHYIIFNFLIPHLWDMMKLEGNKPSFWYADATRYIGYHPDTDDKTAHEFPAYSFLLGDLHAHVINIFVVLTILALLLSFMKQHTEEDGYKPKKTALDPKLMLIGGLLGISMMENFWDFPIYFIVAGSVLLAISLRSGMTGKEVALTTALQGVEVLLIAFAVSLPFHLGFKGMVNGIGISEKHTPVYQLAILWALPLSLLAAHIIAMLGQAEGENLRAVMRSFDRAELFIALIGLCGAGLILMPELIYIKDIYTGSYKRFNTMFKLSYQAFILLGLCTGFSVSRMAFRHRTPGEKKWGIIALVLLIWTGGYFITGLRMSAGNIFDREKFKGLRADRYLEREEPADAMAVEWIKSNVPAGSLVLESPGSSYTLNNRVSVLTGCPTIIGWHTHEWLWRNNVDVVNERGTEVDNIYTSADTAHVRGILEKYGVDYIFVGSCEYEKYGLTMDVNRLMHYGEPVYSAQGESSEVDYVIKVEL
ncbi:MAG: hypothetical protein IKI75_03455 [Lachnospiraceae bacterium]|nr:hypothetical protein [Lachnospiraceae bacterium]